jgi:integrase
MGRVNFTAARIRSFCCPADKKQVFLWDQTQSGLGIRATPNSKTYIFQDRLHGTDKTFRMTIGPADGLTLDKARERAAELCFTVSQGKDPRQELRKETEKQLAESQRASDQKITLADVWPLYIEANKHQWSDRHLKDHERFISQGGVKVKRGKGLTKPGPLAPLMDKKLTEITPEVVKEWAVAESAHRATQCRNAFGLLRACLNWCADKSDYSGLVNTDACSARIKKKAIPPKKAKIDCLQKEQLPIWFKSVRQIKNKIISAYLQTLLLTGARREEIAGLRWADVDFKWCSLTIKDKVEGTRTIPLTPYVASLLSPLPRVNQFVFSSPTAKSGRLQEPRFQHNNALSVAGIEGLTIHGLRRSFGTLSEWVEVPAGVVAQIMGHKPSATAEKHYRQRPLDLLRMWHIKVEEWILNEAGIEVPQGEQANILRMVKG